MTQEKYIGKIVDEQPRGIPECVFKNPNFEGEIPGGSGLNLFCKITPTSIWIIETTQFVDDRNHCGFSASVMNGMFEYCVFTKGFRGDSKNRHPDLFAGKLISAAFDFFARQRTKIDVVFCRWENERPGKLPSDTYRQFLDLSGEDYPPTLERQLGAAKLVWGVKPILEHGFTEIDEGRFAWNRTPGFEKVQVYFRRPSPVAA